MKRIFQNLIVACSLFVAQSAYAKNLIQVAGKLEKNGITTGMKVVVLAIIIAGITFAFGLKDGSTKIAMAILGGLCVFLAPTIVSTLQTWL